MATCRQGIVAKYKFPIAVMREDPATIVLKIQLRLPAAEVDALKWCLVNVPAFKHRLHLAIDRTALRGLIDDQIKARLYDEQHDNLHPKAAKVPANLAAWVADPRAMD